MSDNQKTIKVLCVDDDDLIAHIVRITLKQAGGFEWIGQLRDATNLGESARDSRPDVVLLDLCLPGTCPFVAVRELRDACPSAKVIIFSGRCGHNLVDRTVEAGAWGYLLKDSSDGQTLVSAIRRVTAGEFVLGPQVNADFACPT